MKVCIGKSKQGNFFTLYNIGFDTKEVVDIDTLKALIKSEDIANLYMNKHGSIKCHYLNKLTDLNSSCIAVGVLYDYRTNGRLLGYDIVDISGKNTFADINKVKQMIQADKIKNMLLHHMGMDPTFKVGGEPLYTRYLEDSWTADEKQSEIKKLKEQLDIIFSKLNRISQLEFIDEDCRNEVYKYSGTKIDKENSKICIKIQKEN